MAQQFIGADAGKQGAFTQRRQRRGTTQSLGQRTQNEPKDIMSDLHFTEDEAQLVDAMARDRHGVASRLGFYASVLIPVFIFGAYGIINRDFLATVLSLIGLAIFVCRNLSHESKYVGLYKSIFQKVAQHQRAVAPIAQQAAAGDAVNPRA